MTAEPIPARRPSPRPRPADGQPRPADGPRLRVVPAPNLQSETETAGMPPIADETAGQNLAGSARTVPVAEPASGWRARWQMSKDYWTPPALFTEPPASLAELADYARYAPWTHQDTGLLRGAGIGYHRAVGYPYTVWSRYKEWIVQRPGRLAAHLGLLKLFTLTAPGMWVVDHLVYPAAQVAGHIFL